MKRLFLSAWIVISCWSVTLAQNITGPTSVNVGETHTYTFTNGVVYMSMNWTTGSGTVLNKWQSGATYYASIQWNAPGSSPLYALDNNFVQRGSLTVSISVATPNTTYSITQNCGSTNVLRNATPPNGVLWYWQSNYTGTSTTMGSGATYVATTPTTLFLRARHTSTGTWSATPSSAGSITITAPVATPATATDGYVIADAPTAIPLSVATVSGATSYQWYKGGVVVSGVTTNTYSPVVSAASEVYEAEALNGSCASPSKKVVTAYKYPTPVITATSDGIVVAGKPVTLSVSNFTYDSYQWTTADGTSIPLATQSTYTTRQPGSYKVIVTKSSAQSYTTPNSFKISTGLQGLNMNYIVVNTIQKDNVYNTSDVDTLSVKSRNIAIQYFDGIGRSLQTVALQGSPGRKDVVQPVSYDDVGRQSVNYLPYVDGTNGRYKTDALQNPNATTGTPLDIYRTGKQYQFYQTSNKVAQDQYPYSTKIFENSPLNRVIKQGASGEAWQPDAVNTYTSTDKTVKFSYELNEANEVLQWTYSEVNSVVSIKADVAGVPTFYPANELIRNRTKDEQGNQVITYVDRLGRTILKRVQAISGNPVTTDAQRDANFASTYYIYDALGNLVAVLPPEAVKAMTAN
jgi:hypothetical protein